MLTPRHARITDALRARITAHVYDETGGKLPSESELTREFTVSRTTVRTALQALMNEGLVRSESGVGYFVRDLQRYQYKPQDDLGARPADSKADRFLESAQARNPSQTIEVGVVRVPDYVADRLGLDEDDFVVKRHRIRYLDGTPYLINDSYYPEGIVRGTAVMTNRDISPGVNELLADLGHRQVRALDEIYIRMPYPDEVEMLQILPGTPVAVHVITGYTADDRPVRVVRSVLPGDRHVIAFERGETGPDRPGPRRSLP